MRRLPGLFAYNRFDNLPSPHRRQLVEQGGQVG
jgi:hypothetical protein